VTEFFVHHLPGLVLKGHEFRVPLVHDKPNGEEISVFAREVVASSKESRSIRLTTPKRWFFLIHWDEEELFSRMMRIL
jgi:hypothetical protein